MIIYMINQVALAGFNLVNVRIDAYRIFKHKNIAHGINFAAYAAFCTLLCWLAWLDIWEVIIFCMSAFSNRQFSFDIPLNRRRGLPWDYVSPAKPPKAWLDRQEIRLFGYNGRAPFVAYGIIWLACLVVKFFL
jgi:hypothetical protein